MKKKTNIVLTGMPAVGKSTVGILLAKQMGAGFLDTDILIQTQESRTLAQIIAEKGVNHFLSIEERSLSTVNVTNHVIATGGSAVYSAVAMKHLAENGIIVYLEIGLDVLNRRLSSLDSRGVIRSPGQDIESLYFERTPLYNRYADLRVPCGSNSPQQVVSLLMESLKNME